MKILRDDFFFEKNKNKKKGKKHTIKNGHKNLERYFFLVRWGAGVGEVGEKLVK